MSWFYYFSRFFVHVFFAATTSWRISGRENIPPTEPVIVVCNHLTFAEPPMIGVLLQRPVGFAAKEGFFRFKPLGAIMRSYGAFPVCPGKADKETIRKMESVVKEGRALVIFPEGTRSLQDELLPALTGAALVAHRTGVPILPVAIYGTEQLRKKWWFLKRPVIHINVGKMFKLPAGSGKTDRAEATNQIMKSIADLLPAEYHGAYKAVQE
ncbi:MAG TPA: lysophospholipid acyltransferase family protein [Dehalococcoidales bacterium]|nr:lysophospholipid acyltransferase family protein [Dehalococcoidales bacterium]